MASAGIGDQGDVRPEYLAVPWNFAWHVGAGLDHHRLGLRRGLQHRQRHANEIVVVGTGPVRVPACGEHCGHHLLRRRLAVLPRDGDHWTGEALTACMGQFAEGVQRVVHGIEAQPLDRRRAPPHDGASGACVTRCLEVVMGVESVTHQGDEERARDECPGVGADLRVLRFESWSGEPKRLAYLRGGPRDAHRPTNPSTMARSSNGSFSWPIT